MKSYITNTFLILAALGIGYGDPAYCQQSFSSDQAMVFFRARNWTQLVPYLNAWAKARPKDPMPWYHLGTTYGSKEHGIGMGKPADAKSAFQRALTLKPVWPQAWNALAWTDIELEDYAGAAAAFEHATQQAPTNANYWNSLGSTYSKLGRTAQATNAFNRAKRLGSPDAAANNRILHTPVVTGPMLGNFSNPGPQPFRPDDAYFRRLNPTTGAPLDKYPR